MSSPELNQLTRRGLREHECGEPNAAEQLTEDNYDEEEEEFNPSIQSSPNRLYPDLSNHTESSFSYESNASPITGQRTPETLRPCHRKTSDSSETSNVSCYILMAIPVILVGVMLFLYFYPEPEEKQGDVSRLLLICQMMKSHYPKLSKLSQRIIKESLRRVIEPNSVPLQPSVILLIGAESITYKLSKDLASRIISNYSEFKCIDVKTEDSLYIKNLLGNEMNKFGQHQLNVLLIKDIDLIPGESALVLHSYCDHENAPFKKSVIIMTVSSNEPIDHDSDDKMMDRHALAALREAWSDLHKDQLEPLLARLAVSVAAVH